MSSAVKVISSKRNAHIDNFAVKIVQSGFVEASKIPMAQFLLLIEQAGKIHWVFLQKNPHYTYHPAIPRVTSLLAL